MELHQEERPWPLAAVGGAVTSARGPQAGNDPSTRVTEKRLAGPP